jgi:hypothetical protein
MWSEVPERGAPATERPTLWVADGSCQFSGSAVCEPGSCAPVEIVPPSADAPLCVHGCRYTPDLTGLVFLDAEASTTLRYVPVGTDLQLAGAPVVIATGISSWSVGTGAVAYQVGSDVFVYDIASGQSRQITSFAGVGGFHLSDDGSTVFVKRVTSATGISMDLQRFNADGTGEQLLYTFLDADVTGSLLTGSEPVALSPDGSTLAILTGYRLQSNPCTTSADCTETGYTCIGGIGSRCNSHQLALQTINLAQTARLNQPCATDGDCGSRHFCDQTNLDGSGQGSCQPGRILLGYAGQNTCTLLRLGNYDRFVGDIRFSATNRVMGILRNTCGTQDINVTDLVEMDIDARTFRALVENPGSNFGNCYDEVEQCTRAQDCTVELFNASVSPQGAWVGLVANSFRSAQSRQAWLYDVRGGRKFPLPGTFFQTVRTAQVLAGP